MVFQVEVSSLTCTRLSKTLDSQRFPLWLNRAWLCLKRALFWPQCSVYAWGTVFGGKTWLSKKTYFGQE